MIKYPQFDIFYTSTSIYIDSLGLVMNGLRFLSNRLNEKALKRKICS